MNPIIRKSPSGPKIVYNTKKSGDILIIGSDGGIESKPFYFGNPIPNKPIDTTSEIEDRWLELSSVGGKLTLRGVNIISNLALPLPDLIPFCVEGEGWNCRIVSLEFGNSYWLLDDAPPYSGPLVTGSVLMQRDPTPGPMISAQGLNSIGNVQLNNFALVANGKSGSIGLSLDDTVVSEVRTTLFGVCNADVGFRFGCAENCIIDIRLFGCNVGFDDIHLHNPTLGTNNQIFAWAQNCNTGCLITCQSLLRISGLFQVCKTAINLVPASTTIVELTIFNSWFEQPGNPDIIINTIDGGFQSLAIAPPMYISGGMFIRKGFAGGNPCNGMVLSSAVYAPSWLITIAPPDNNTSFLGAGAYILDYGVNTKFIASRPIPQGTYLDSDENVTGVTPVISWDGSQATTGTYTSVGNPTLVNTWTGGKKAIELGAGDSFTKPSFLDTNTYLIMPQVSFVSLPAGISYLISKTDGTINVGDYIVEVDSDGVSAKISLIRTDGVTTKKITTNRIFVVGIDYALAFGFDGLYLYIILDGQILVQDNGSTGIGPIVTTTEQLNGIGVVGTGNVKFRRTWNFLNPFQSGVPYIIYGWGKQYTDFVKELG
jgi:hypothetical protein